MPARQAELKARVAKKRVVKHAAERISWCGAKASPERMEAFGFRLTGGGAHQSKTMMLSELQALLATTKPAPRYVLPMAQQYARIGCSGTPEY